MARKITIEFLGQDKSLGKTIDGIEGKSGRLTGVLGKVGKVAAAGLAVGGAAAVAGGKHFFDLAATVEQMGQKADTVFGSQIGKVDKWAAANAHAMGLTRTQATGLAANFGDLLIPMGFTRKQAASMSTDVVGLSGALSQWSGGTVSAADASDVLAKAMLGERDGLKALGISISEADVKAELMRQGQDKLTGAALQQATAQATQALIMQKSTDAQAAFAAGGSPLLSAQAQLKAKFGEMQETIATKLIPVFTQMADWFLTKGLPAIQKFGGWLGEHMPPIFERVQAVVSTVMGALKGDVGGGLGRVRDIFVNVTSIITSLWDRFGGALTDYAVKSFANVKQVIGGALKVVQGIFQTFSSLLKGDWAGAWDGIKKIVSGAWEVIKGVVKQALNIMSTLMEVGWSAVKGIVSTAWDGIKTAVSKGVARVVEFVREIPGKALDALGNLGSTLSTAGQNLIQGLIDGITAKLGALKDKLLSVTKLIPDWKGPLDKDKILLTPAGEALMEGLINGIEKKKKKLQSVLEKITDHIKKKQDALATLLDKRQSIVDSFKGMASSVFGASLGTEESPASVDKLVEFQRNQRSRAEQLNSSVGTLVGKGLSKDMINQLIASGQSGVDQINLLATATDAQIADLVANNAATQAALEAAGLKASEALIGDRIAQAERDVVLADTIRDKLKELLEQQDKNTVVQLILDGKVLHASLLKLKREKRGKLELA